MAETPHMVDMAKTGQEMEESGVPVEARGDEPIYPWSLCLTLNKGDIEKLGLDCSDGDCAVGSYLHIHALAEVTGIHKTSTQDGENTSINLQITHMACESEDEENEESEEDIKEGHVYRQAGRY